MTAVALSPVLDICKSSAPLPLSSARCLPEVASASRFLSFEGSDEDMQVDIDIDAPAPSQAQSCSGELRHQLDGSSSIVSSFSLVGTVMHTGRTLDSGHYYADVRCNGRWVRVNDTSVQPLDWDPRRLQNPSWSHMAYVQMYACPSSRSNSLQMHALRQ